MPAFVDYSGRRFGSLVALHPDRTKPPGLIWYVCQCDCGSTKSVRGGCLKAGTTVTCGATEHRSARHRGNGQTHGLSSSRTYEIWSGLKKRCQNPKHHAFANYGGRGIRVCERWQAFENFLADMGEAPEGMEIDRKDVNGHYEPSNCRWVDLIQQANNRRSNRVVDGLTIAQVAARDGINYSTAYWRHVIRDGAQHRG